MLIYKKKLVPEIKKDCEFGILKGKGIALCGRCFFYKFGQPCDISFKNSILKKCISVFLKAGAVRRKND